MFIFSKLAFFFLSFEILKIPNWLIEKYLEWQNLPIQMKIATEHISDIQWKKRLQLRAEQTAYLPVYEVK